MRLLSKTKFLHYLQCQHEFELIAEHPALKPKITESDLFPIEEGIQFEKRVQEHFDLANGQAQFEFKTELFYAKTDIVKFTGDHQVDLYEIKASTRIKDEHIWDLAFQRFVAEKAGYIVRNTFLIHANKEYIFNGLKHDSALYTIEDVGEAIMECFDQIESKAIHAYEILQGIATPNSEHHCPNTVSCQYLSHKDIIPEFNISLIPRLGAKRFWDLWHKGIKSVNDLSVDMKLSPTQKNVADILSNRKSQTDKKGLRKRLDELVYPLYFLDYETYQPSIPIFQGYSPFERFVFQYSLHVMDHPRSKIRHYEYILNSSDLNIHSLIRALQSQIGDTGNVVVWYAPFEKSCNQSLGDHYPEFAPFFDDLNSRVFDQMDIFKDGLCIDYRFKGSNSIKSVLPVLIPELNYERLNISKGDIASYRWKKAVLEKNESYKEEETIKDLLEYCELDTYAMVSIHKKLFEKISK